jgi:dTDP-4-amino-4,6-dideoxygalactose transaminase
VAGVYSFHGTKNVSCGEGGAVLTDNKELADKMDIYRANGTNRNAFLAGIVDKYSWVGKGTSFYLSDILASIVSVQVDQITKIVNKRYQIASKYTKKLKPFNSVIRLPTIPEGVSPNWHIYAVRFNKSEHRNAFIKDMRKKGIDVSYHYVPLHSSRMGKSLGGQYNLPVTENVASTLVRLPIYPGLTREQLTYITSTAKTILASLR